MAVEARTGARRHDGVLVHVLLDTHLPDIDGLELMRHLMEDDDLGSIPAVVAPVEATPAQVAAALTSLAARHFTKPGNLADFLTCVDKLPYGTHSHFGRARGRSTQKVSVCSLQES